MRFFAGMAATVLVLATGTGAQTSSDPKMTRAERAELIELLNKSEQEFLQAVEGLTN